MSTPGPRCKSPANKMWNRWLSQQAKWHFAGKWYFPNQISAVSLFEYVLNRQLRVREKPSDKKKKTKTKKPFFPAQFSERWLNHELLSLLDSQYGVLLFRYQNIHKFFTFFGPGFALLYAITYGVLYSNMKNVTQVYKGHWKVSRPKYKLIRQNAQINSREGRL